VALLASLRGAYPGARIDWLVQDSFADAVMHHPALTGVVSFPRRRFSRWASPSVTGEVVRWMRGLRRARYDLAIDAQGLARSGIFCYATGARVRVGYADAPEGAWLAYTVRADSPRTLHTVERMMRLLGPLAVQPVMDMRLYPPPAEIEKVEADAELKGKRFAVIAATSRWAGKQWAPERFAVVADRLVGDPVYGIDAVVLVGGAGEREQIAPLLALAGRRGGERRVIDRVGATSVGGLMALVRASSVVIANDSAALHMAVAFERPLVALFGPTRVDLVGPWKRERDVIQHVAASDVLNHKNAAAGKLLMDRITVAEVLAKAQGAVAGKPRGTAEQR
jgi:heptosyltransferase-1